MLAVIGNTTYAYDVKIWVPDSDKTCSEGDTHKCCTSKYKAGDLCDTSAFKEYCSDDSKLVLCESSEDDEQGRIVFYDCAVMNHDDSKYVCATFDKSNCYEECIETEKTKDYCDSEPVEGKITFERMKCEASKDEKIEFVWHDIASLDCDTDTTGSICCKGDGEE